MPFHGNMKETLGRIFGDLKGEDFSISQLIRDRIPKREVLEPLADEILKPLADVQPESPLTGGTIPPTEQSAEQPVELEEEIIREETIEPTDRDFVILKIEEYFPEDPEIARAIFTQESQLGLHFQNLEGSPDYGIAQINLPTWTDRIPVETEEEKIEWLRDPDNNLSLARIIYEDSLERHGDGWLPWVGYTSGAYKEFL